MKRLIDWFRSKLSFRISLWIVLFAAIVFISTFMLLFVRISDAVQGEAVSRATQILDKTSLQVEGILNRVEVATDMTGWLVSRHLDNPDSMFVYSRGILLNNPEFYNCSIAFEPNYFKNWGRYFSAYSKHIGTDIRTIQGGNDNYQYFYKDWYLMAKLLDRPCWTEPYIDLDVPTGTSEMVSSYCKPIKDEEGKIIGVVNTGLSLNWLSQTISAVKPYPNSYSIMTGRGGTFFVHPDPSKITRQTIFTQTIEHPDTALISLGHAMQRGEEGMKQMEMEGNQCFVFYKPLGKTGCSMAIVCPESDIFGGFNRLRRIIMIIVVEGLMLMLFFFIRIIARELSPLRQLAAEAETIASGKLDAELPEYKRIDEIGQLSRSFSDMQQALVKYIDELKNTTAQKASIERDLHIANSIQMGMLPKNFPTGDDMKIYASLTPAKDVGGDLFDFYFRDGKLFFCIGDVSGKGVPASLFMAVTRSVFRTVSAREDMPDRIMESLNNTIVEMNETFMFVTLFIGTLDLSTGYMYYCNAGHNAPMLIGAGVGILPCDPNIAVGMMPDRKFSLQEAQIYTGTTIFLFTDGLTEAEDIDHNMFGQERVTEVATEALALCEQAPRSIIARMTDAVHSFVGDAPQSDDLTMMAIQFTKNV